MSEFTARLREFAEEMAGDPATWALPASYAAVAVIGLGWGLVLKIRRPRVYAAIGLGAHAVTVRRDGQCLVFPRLPICPECGAGFDVLNETAYECVLEIERYAVKLGCRQIA